MRGLAAPALACAILFASGLPVLAQPAPDISAVVETLARTRAARDLDGALGQFADDAVVTIQSGRATQVFAGRDQVRAYLQGVASSRSLMRSSYRVDGAFVRWSERDEDSAQTFDTVVQATIQNGRISTLLIQQTQAFGTVTGAGTAAAPRQPPSLAWALGLGSAFALGLGLVFRPRRRQTQSVLDGRLVSAMRSYHGGRV